MRKKSGKVRLFKRLAFLLFISLLLSSVIYMFLFSSIFRIETVDIDIRDDKCDDQIDKSKILGRNIFLLNPNQLKIILKDEMMCFKDIRVNKNFPNKVTLDFIKRDAIAKIASLEEKEASMSSVLTEATVSGQILGPAFLLDEDGLVFAQASSENLPKLLIAGQNINIGISLEVEKLRKIIMIFEKNNQLNMGINEVVLTGKNHVIALSLEYGFIMAFDLGGDVKEQLASLQLILDKSKINDEKIEYLDLRFSNPIVKYAPKEK